MKLVVDASVIAFFVMPDEGGDKSHPIYRHLIEDDLIAPDLHWYEVRNIVVKSVRRERLPGSELDIVLAAIETFPIGLRPAGASANIVSLASMHALSFYDASYLALAIAENASLATLDRSLSRAAQAEGVLLRV